MVRTPFPGKGEYVAAGSLVIVTFPPVRNAGGLAMW